MGWSGEAVADGIIQGKHVGTATPDLNAGTTSTGQMTCARATRSGSRRGPYPSQMTAAEGVRQALEDIVWRCSTGIPRPLLLRKGLCKELRRALAAELQRDLDSRQEEALSRARQDSVVGGLHGDTGHDTCWLWVADAVGGAGRCASAFLAGTRA